MAISENNLGNTGDINTLETSHDDVHNYSGSTFNSNRLATLDDLDEFLKENLPFVLVTGGSGYIGSHTVLRLLESNYQVIVIDNLSNSCEESLKRVQKLTGKPIIFCKVDLLDRIALYDIFSRFPLGVIKSVIHFAGLKAVGESVSMPLSYYHNNITGTIYLVEAMKKYLVKNLVFSSSATVYGEPEKLPLTEECRLGATNPYGRTKQFIEEILKDVTTSDPEWKIMLLRYFNPVGAHVSGQIGEDPLGIPNNLMPFVSQVAIGKRPVVNVFGNDYPTKDGTGMRDYIHVVDLAEGHVAALRKILKTSPTTQESNRNGSNQVFVYNLGTGQPYSVLDMIKTMSKSSGREIPYKVTSRRAGDVASVYADVKKAEKDLNWTAKLGLVEMCDDLWRWQKLNPSGFRNVSQKDIMS